ncbi:MAG: S8 family serine peptidase [Candidatus Acidiferrum sp.]
MKRWFWAFALLLSLFIAKPSAAQQRFIVRTTLGLPGLQTVCLLDSCQVLRSLDGTVGQLFVLTTSDLVNPDAFLAVLRLTPGIADAEVDQVLTIVSDLANVATIPPGLSDNTQIDYFGSQVWNGYANQPAASIVRVPDAHTAFGVSGTGIVADIDTGVDPTHPAFANILLPGYDFTRNQAGGSELPDYPFSPPAPCPSCPAANVNQSSAAILDQSSAAILDGGPYSAFGHGTMVVGVIHLVAPTALIMPLKSFQANGTGYLSDILRAIYYAVQNQANVINMSFDFTSSSTELATAVNYAAQNDVICVASVGNDGAQELVYPAALANVMGVASTSDLDTRSGFSNYGSDVWVAAPGEGIVTTYPFSTYAAGWGTSFSAPFVSGGASLLLSLNRNTNPTSAAQAMAHAKQLTPTLGNGRLDLYLALGSLGQ